MSKDILRNSFVLIIAIYSFYKLLNLKPQNRLINISLILSSLIISICSTLFFSTNQSLNWLFILFMYFLLMKHISRLNLSTTYTAVLFSFSLSFIAFIISGIITSLVMFPFYFQNYEVPWLVIRLLVGIIHFILIYSCFKIPRLKRGMTFLYHIPSGNIGSTLCILFIFLVILYGQTQTAVEAFTLKYVSPILIFSLLLLYWWNYHLTQTYKKYLKINELATLELLLLEKDTEIDHLKSENDKLSRLIHKDNKILPALTMAIEDFLKNADKLSLAELNHLGVSLQTQLTLLYNERLSILNSYEQDFYTLPSSGFTSVNGVLMFMQQKASQLGIQYQLIISDNPSSIIPNTISEKDFSHLLSDLLDNAVIAAKNSHSGIVRIHMGYFDDIYTLKIFNTGHPFSVNVLQNIGINRYTTHENTGGSGIGLMDIWKLKEQYSFTLLIDETTSNTHETKSTTINILFNTKNHYIIQTDRYKELVSSINRPDLLILPKN